MNEDDDDYDYSQTPSLEVRVSRLEAAHRKRRHLIDPDLGWWLVSLLGALLLYLFFV